MLGLIGRLLLVAIGAVAAAIAAVAVVVSLGSERLVQAVPEARIGNEDLSWVLGWLEHAQFLWGLAALSSIVPGLIAIAIGEIGRIRSLLYYVAAGGAALVVLPWLAQVSSGEALALPKAVVLQVLATAGFAAGLVYWAVAGRRA